MSFSRVLSSNALEERLEIKPSVEAFILVFGLNHAKEVIFCDVFELDVPAMTSFRSHLGPIVVVGRKQILMLEWFTPHLVLMMLSDYTKVEENWRSVFSVTFIGC